jgi:hypothetical protein
MPQNDIFKIFHTDKAMGPRDRNWGRIESLFKPSPQDIAQAQIDLGYHPLGYGGPDCVEIRKKGEVFITTWAWGYSCD